MAEEKTVESNAPPKVKISVDYHPSRWGEVYHIFDLDGREIALQRKDAVQMARNILKIAGQK